MKVLEIHKPELRSIISTALINLVAILILIAFIKRDSIISGILFFIGTNIFNYYCVYPTLYQFRYDSKVLIITNSWRVSFEKEYQIKDIERIEVNSYNG